LREFESASDGGVWDVNTHLTTLPGSVGLLGSGSLAVGPETQERVAPCGISQDLSRALKILVVDDNADALLLMALRLRKLGYDVRKAGDGQTALQLAAEYRPDVVLMDLSMPGIDGYAAARRLRQLEGGRVLLIALTGYDDAESRRRAQDAGFDHHMVKPVETAELSGLLSQHA
jgi:CheY-like chemotaxis protein